MSARLSEKELAELLSKNPKLKTKVAEKSFKAQRTAIEIVPQVRNEKELLENEIQTAYFAWVLEPSNIELMPELDLIYAIPNGSNKSKTERWLHQQTGLRSGVPDIHVPVSRKPFFSLYIEVKRYKAFQLKNHDCSANQLLWHEKLRKQGHKVIVEYSLAELIRLTKEYLGYQSDGI